MFTTLRSRVLVSLGTLAVSTVLAGCHSYKDDALQAIRQEPRHSDVAGCVADAVKRNPAARGSLELALEMAPNGKVNRLAFPSDSVKDPQLTECVKQKAANWDMRIPSSGKMETFVYKFQVRG